MAFFDWNGDGKKDLIDECIEFNIYNKCMKKNKNQRLVSNGSVSNESAKGFWISFLLCCVIAGFNQLLAALIFVIYLFLKLMY